MSLFGKLLGNPQEKTAAQTSALPNTVYAPLTGEVISIEQIGDGVFSDGILGPGIGMEPAEDKVCAPFDGTITQVSDTKHAVGVTSNHGIELLIHIGMDTVEMNGKGFAAKVKIGQKVSLGDELLTFDSAAIRAAGHPTVSAIVVTNSDRFGGVDILSYGHMSHGTPVIQVREKA